MILCLTSLFTVDKGRSIVLYKTSCAEKILDFGHHIHLTRHTIMGGFQYTGLLIGLYFGVLFTFTSGAANATVGSICKDNGNCSTIQHSVCDATKKTCQCSPNFFVSSNKTLCLPKIAVNAVCNIKDKHQCLDINAECRSSNGVKCLCKDAYYLKGTACTSQIAVNAVCNTNDKHQCKDINAECKSSNRTKCLCKDAYYLKGTTCTSRSGVSKTFIEISTIILAILALRCNKWFVE